jgi:hypothetical protein
MFRHSFLGARGHIKHAIGRRTALGNPAFAASCLLDGSNVADDESISCASDRATTRGPRRWRAHL